MAEGFVGAKEPIREGQITAMYLLSVDFKDGCRLVLNPPSGDPSGFQFEMGLVKFTCPYGEVCG